MPSSTTACWTFRASISRRLDGKTFGVVLREHDGEPAEHGETLFRRLRKVRIHGPADLSTNHDAYALGEPDA